MFGIQSSAVDTMSVTRENLEVRGQIWNMGGGGGGLGGGGGGGV